MKALLSILLLLVLYVPTAFGQHGASIPLVTVTGTAEVLVVPDQAELRLTVKTLDMNLQIARTKNDDLVKRVFTLAAGLKVEGVDLQTDSISVEPEYQEDDETAEPRKFLGYSMSKRVVIVVRDVAILDRLITGIVEAGVDRLDDIDFRSSTLREHSDEARLLAVRAAKQKATAMAKELGQTIGKAVIISEEQLPYGSAANNTGLAGRVAVGDSVESTVALGRIRVSARILVAFELH